MNRDRLIQDMRRYNKIKNIIIDNMTGLGVLVSRVANEANTSSNKVHFVASRERNMKIVELSGSDRIVLKNKD